MSTTTATTKELAVPSGSLGVFFKGVPPTVSRLREGSPLEGQLQPGDVVQAVRLADGTEHKDFGVAGAVGNVLREHADSPKRVLIVLVQKQDQEEPVPEQAPVAAVIKEQEEEEQEPLEAEEASTDPDDEDEDDEDVGLEVVMLPVGSLGLGFRGTPPSITAVKKTSVLGGQVQVGQIVRKLLLPDGSVVTDLTTPTLVDKLNQHLDSDGGRQLVLETPPPPEPEEEEPEQAPEPKKKKRGLFGKR